MRLIDADALMKIVDSEIERVEKEMRDAEERPNLYTDEFREHKSYTVAGMAHIAQDILEAPTIDAVPVRHGGWEKNDDYTCSLCGYRMVIGDGAYNYCPHCGAKMDGEEKNCDTCKHYDKGWDDIICDGCTKAYSNWERKDND